ncbi:MAG TPA: Gfo/Idh/MocA family oxidoreductase [Caulobacterales bacterium]|nr:Gfo/Idh/MocA family oxidoreductase [Caulobacterales bacterium]
MRIRAGLIGYGLAGRLLHAPLIACAGIDIAAIVTSRAAEARADFPGAAVLGNLDELCARDDVQLAIVVTPDHLHAGHVRAALEAGKHVVVDKPFAPTSAEALALIRLAQARGRMLTVYQNRRWDADFRTLQKLMAENALGEIVHYQARWDRYRPAARGDWHDAHMQGELFGLGPHLMDQALVLFGAPDWLCADVYDQRGLGTGNDGCEILMGKGRLRISLAINMLAADEMRSLRVLGTRGAFAKRGLDPQEARLRSRERVDAPDFGADAEADWGVLTDAASRNMRAVASERGDWAAFYRGVRDALTLGTAPPVDPRGAAQAIAMLEAALLSSESGRRIDVPEFLKQRGF